jgi:hypothetical protein
MDDETRRFLVEMAKGADETTHELELQEARVCARLGVERVLDLKKLWAREFDPVDEDEFKRSMDWSDKELIWIWARLERSRERRLLAGRGLMTGTKTDET